MYLCCPISGQSHGPWPGSPDTQVLEMASSGERTRPPGLPRDLVDRVARLHGDPDLWWVSQFLRFMVRPQPHTRAMLQATEESFQFKHPIVGIHIRRTDKVHSFRDWPGKRTFLMSGRV